MIPATPDPLDPPDPVTPSPEPDELPDDPAASPFTRLMPDTPLPMAPSLPPALMSAPLAPGSAPPALVPVADTDASTGVYVAASVCACATEAQMNNAASARTNGRRRPMLVEVDTDVLLTSDTPFLLASNTSPTNILKCNKPQTAKLSLRILQLLP